MSGSNIIMTFIQNNLTRSHLTTLKDIKGRKLNMEDLQQFYSV